MAEGKLMLDERLSDMVKVHNEKMYKIHLTRKSAGTIPNDAVYTEMKKDEVRQLVIETIENDLSNKSKGSTLQEMGAHLAIHFGKESATFQMDTYVDPANLSPDMVKKLQREKNKEREAKKVEWEKRRKVEVREFTALVEEYLKSSYGEYIKDPIGRKVALGENIRIDETLHFKKD